MKRISRILGALGIGVAALCCVAPILIAAGVVTGGAAMLLGVFEERLFFPVLIVSGLLLFAGLRKRRA